MEMYYVVSRLITTEDGNTFCLLGQSEDKKKAVDFAVAAYREYNKAASAQNVAMIAEWLATRGEYSFRLDKHNRLQLAITPLTNGEATELTVFVAKAEEDAQMLRLSQALIDGKAEAVFKPGQNCPGQ